MTILAFRNRTQAFKQIRDDIIRRRERFHLGPSNVQLTQKLLPEQSPPEVEMMTLGHSDYSAIPGWMIEVEHVQGQLTSLRETLDRLQKVQKRKMALVFENKESDHSIIILSNEVNEKMQSVDATIKKIARTTPDEDPMTCRLRLNAARSLAAEAAELNKKYRQGQRQFIQESKFNVPVALEEEKADEYRHDDQRRQMQLMRSQNQNRRQEFEHVTRTMEEIQIMFAHTSTLIIDQGSMLDRIDVNIERTLEGAEKGNAILHQIENRQRSGVAKQVSKILLVLNIIMLVLNLLKFWPRRLWPF